MKLYAVSYWVPFPSSEYGGLQIWAAEGREALEEALLEHAQEEDKYECATYSNWRGLVQKSARTALELTTERAGMLASFTT